MHERQTVEFVYQNSFTNLCDQLERDLAGCKSWGIQNTLGSNTSLFVERIEEQITYDVCFETGNIIQRRKDGEILFPFKGERDEGAVKTMRFVANPHKANELNLKIELKTEPAIVFAHDFSVRISADNIPGFFLDPELKERKSGAEAHIGKK